ncbi:hypothetical protein ACPPVU_02480 [Mucilaginibacter sp. McL0603]|uniref:hypothetical protein n=1 Tax=Mucilaginibacter sp. McL0603 TaxID=3415670 RepID=UPI003CF4A3C1
MANIIPEQIHIVSIQVTNANVSMTKGNELLEKNKAFDITFNSNTSLSLEDKEFCKIDFTVGFLPAEQLKDQTDFSASFSIDFVFSIENLENFKVQVPGVEHGFLLDSTLGITLMGIVYSTARGIILTRTAGTVLDSILLPVINPANLLVIQETNK